MAGSATKPATDADTARAEAARADADPAGPIELAELYLRGVTLAGQPVTLIVVETADGADHKLRPPVRPTSARQALSELESRVVDLFRRFDVDRRVKGSEVASLLDEAPGTIRKALADLTRRRVLGNDGDGDGYHRGREFPV